ncbi:GNAT family N-acetyltransferase [Candidatus Woesearchaeota archaeon]|nr:GNAT family N-acetyltransferase [Candidatus Woesearchaeota archaeon]
MAIRRMTLSDLDAVVDLYQDANLYATKEEILAWTKKGLLNFAELNLVDQRDERIVGAISVVLKSKSVAEINDIAVLAEYRKQNVGSALFSEMMSIIESMKLRKVVLWVHWSSARAVPFYYKFGFRITKCAKTKGIEGIKDGDDIIHMEKKL